MKASGRVARPRTRGGVPATHQICGEIIDENGEVRGGGVLDWAYGEADAAVLLMIYQGLPRHYRNITVRPND